MLELFTNPGYLAAGGALVSSPIIIHLINRMRFRRVRWAAMEFLLKSQKRNRRRLIIEQLILLALRCLLVVLTALLVARFVGFSLASFEGQDSLHVVVLDDTLSLGDRHADGTQMRTAFQVAKEDVLLGGIVKSLGQSTTNERLAILPLSKVVEDPDYQPVIYQRLNDPQSEKEVTEALAQMKPAKLHVPLVRGLKRAEALLGDHPEKRHRVHVVSDFRQIDWAGPGSQELHKVLQSLQDRGVKVRLTDAAHPFRTEGQGGVPVAHDNLGLLDFRAGTRVVGRGMPVTFTVDVANFSPNDRDVQVLVYDSASGKEMAQVDFNPRMPMKVKAGSVASATFEMRLFPNIAPGEKFYSQRLTAHLVSAQRTELDNDGVPDDNVRHAEVEVREKVPVLVVDGAGRQGREEGKDSFFIENAVISVPGASYEVVHGDDVAGGNPVKALERPDLAQYPTVFLLNVPQLNKKQVANLEEYVRQGGGVAFFAGPLVDGDHYNAELFRDGQGVFPVPLKKTFFPPRGEAPLEPKFTGDPQLLLRDKSYTGTGALPIFGKVFVGEGQQDFLRDLPIQRYYPVPRSQWDPEPGRVFELATLPNDQSAVAFQRNVIALVEKLAELGAQKEYAPYLPGLTKYAAEVRQVVAPGSDQKSYQLAAVLDRLLKEAGDEKDRAAAPDLTRFWGVPDPKVRTLRAEVERLRDGALYGDPLVVAQTFGKGRVVAVLTTAGKDWNSWGGGSGASFVYQPFVWEMQNWLSSQGSESNLSVGTPVKIDVDTARFEKQGGGRLAVARTFFGCEPGQPARVVRDRSPNFGTEPDKGLQSFVFEGNAEPGFYLSQLYHQGDDTTPLAAWGHVFNVDTNAEGRLLRLAEEDLQRAVQSETPLTLHSRETSFDDLINRRTDLSESPVFFLLFLIILVCEQALAVHLSFHLKGQEGEALPPAAVLAGGKAA